MTNLLGLGGECVVIEKYLQMENVQTPCALRVSPINASGKMREIGGITVGIDNYDTYKKVNVPDMRVKKFRHKNIIKYLDTTFEHIDNELHHVTGKFKFTILS